MESRGEVVRMGYVYIIVLRCLLCFGLWLVFRLVCGNGFGDDWVGFLVFFGCEVSMVFSDIIIYCSGGYVRVFKRIWCVYNFWLILVCCVMSIVLIVVNGLSCYFFSMGILIDKLSIFSCWWGCWFGF